MKLEEAREQALEKLKVERRMATPYEVALVAALGVVHDVAPDIWRQLEYDLRTYRFYDVLAMWLDVEHGLAAAVPDMMAAVARLFLEVNDG